MSKNDHEDDRQLVAPAASAGEPAPLSRTFNDEELTEIFLKILEVMEIRGVELPVHVETIPDELARDRQWLMGRLRQYCKDEELSGSTQGKDDASADAGGPPRITIRPLVTRVKTPVVASHCDTFYEDGHLIYCMGQINMDGRVVWPKGMEHERGVMRQEDHPMPHITILLRGAAEGADALDIFAAQAQVKKAALHPALRAGGKAVARQIQNFEAINRLARLATRMFQPNGNLIVDQSELPDEIGVVVESAAFRITDITWRELGGSPDIPEYVMMAPFLGGIIRHDEQTPHLMMQSHLPLEDMRDCWRGLYYELAVSKDYTGDLYADRSMRMAMPKAAFDAVVARGDNAERTREFAHDLRTLWDRIEPIFNGLVEERFGGDLRQHAGAIRRFDGYRSQPERLQKAGERTGREAFPRQDDLMTLAMLARLARAVTVFDSRVMLPPDSVRARESWPLTHQRIADYFGILEDAMNPADGQKQKHKIISPVGAPRRPTSTHHMATQKGGASLEDPRIAALWNQATPPASPH